MKTFTNGFQNWAETHFEMTQAITIQWMSDRPCKAVQDAHTANGHAGLYDLSIELTDEFENVYKNLYTEEFDGDCGFGRNGVFYWDVIEKFIQLKFQA